MKCNGLCALSLADRVALSPVWASESLLDLCRANLMWVMRGSASHLCCCPNWPSSYSGKEGMASLRNQAIYKINIKSSIYYAQMILWESSSGCIFAEHQPPRSINCPVLRRNTIQFARGSAARCNCLSTGK